MTEGPQRGSQEESDDDHGGDASGRGRSDLTTTTIETQATAVSMLT
jgi:hypothetical protein